MYRRSGFRIKCGMTATQIARNRALWSIQNSLNAVRYVLTLAVDSGIILGNAKLARIMEITG
ncbi:MAG: hypothetical protein ABIL62_11810 [Planctomycetota bacterium]